LEKSSLSLCLPVSLSLCLPVSLSVCVSMSLSVSVCLCLSMSLSVYVFLYISLSLEIYRRLCVSVSQCLDVSMSRAAFTFLRKGYGVATIRRLLEITGLFCKRALQKRHRDTLRLGVAVSRCLDVFVSILTNIWTWVLARTLLADRCIDTQLCAFSMIKFEIVRLSNS